MQRAIVYKTADRVLEVYVKGDDALSLTDLEPLLPEGSSVGDYSLLKVGVEDPDFAVYGEGRDESLVKTYRLISDLSEVEEIPDGAGSTLTQNLLKYATKGQLIEKYARPLLNPLNQGSIEDVIDVLVQMAKVWRDSTEGAAALSTAQKDAFDAMYTAASPQFKIPDFAAADASVWTNMASRKEDARDAETAMRADPNWPS